MNDDTVQGLAYLATPYSKYPRGIECAFVDAARLSARLMQSGVKVYSPIVHCHPMAVHGGINPLDHALWIPFDEAMMRVASALIVAHLPGWEASYGVGKEVEFFERAGKPIFDMDPDTMAMVRRRLAA